MKDLHEDDNFGSVGERLARYEEVPSDEVWTKISARQKVDDSAWVFWVENASFVLMGVLLLWTLNANVVIKEDKVSAKTNETRASLKNEEPELPVNESPAETGSREETQSTREEIQSTREEMQTEIHHESSEPPAALNLQSATTALRGAVDSQPVTTADSTISLSKQAIATPPNNKKKDEVVPPYKKPRHKFQLYFSIMPSLSFQKMTPNGNDRLIVEGFENRSPLSMKRFGFGIDAGFQRDINRIFGYYGGISFYRQQQELTYRYFDSEADVTRVGDSWTFEINRPQHTRTFDYTMTNIGARSGILVTLKGEKLKHKFGAGLIYSQGLTKSADSYNNSRSAYLSFQLFYRNEVKINERLAWFVEPTFIYGFLSREKLAEPFSLKPYRAGLSAGILYKF